MVNDADLKRKAEALLKIVRELNSEVHRQAPIAQVVSLDSTLDHDLGLDSLARMELIRRIEKHYDVLLPERVFAELETARDLLRAVLRENTPKESHALPDISQMKLGDVETIPQSAQTLIDVLYWHTSVHPERPHIQFYGDKDTGDILTYRQILQGAERVAKGLQHRGLKPGETVAIMLPPGQDYFFSFFGILLAGGIPVPIYPPVRPAQFEDHIRRHRRILANCLAVALVTVSEAKLVAHLLKSQVQTLRHIITVKDLASSPGALERPVIGPRDIAFLQYTSGSTGNPKGVVLTHANLLTNIRAMGARMRINADDVFVSWLPLYHDMGLIGAWLGSMYHAALLVLMSPLVFLARPQHWLWAIHRYRGTVSASPNFGYELCLRRIADQDLKGLDLSCWRAAFNGAEPISPETIRKFCKRFRPHGFRPEAMMPVYGLAEGCLGLAFPPLGRGPVIDRIQRGTFMQDGRAIINSEMGRSALEFVACGRPLEGHPIRIVDPTGRELPDRQEGRLQFRGPSATSGYFRNSEETRRLFRGDWLDSGDLAYMADGDIYLTGRTKDIIIRAGRNIYPHELEEAIGNIDGIRAGRVTVFGSVDSISGTERLVVLAETRTEDAHRREQLRIGINTLVSERVGAPPDDVVLAPPGTVLKTSSGKVRRSASRDIYERGLIGSPPKAVWWQFVRLALAGGVLKLRRARKVAMAAIYGTYARTAFLFIAPTVWLLVVLSPWLSWRWTVMRRAARILARITGIPIVLHGLENLLPQNKPCIYVSNHASYLDGLVIAGVLPGRFSFVAKSELAKWFVSRVFLERIQADFVERFDAEKGVEDFRRLAQAARASRTFFFFPEGTFINSTGLLPFHMGAFIAAAEANVPVVPIAIRGTRSILRGDSWLPNRGQISVHIGKPIDAGTIKTHGTPDTWRLAVGLRDAAREHILINCGEPDRVDVVLE
ncbi:MAG: AMP-binding protein [Deltaproteobacteria bacterium]|nr:AMP-binding protein [Deltaproteobacteria bacterium]